MKISEFYILLFFTQAEMKKIEDELMATETTGQEVEKTEEEEEEEELDKLQKQILELKVK